MHLLSLWDPRPPSPITAGGDPKAVSAHHPIVNVPRPHRACGHRVELTRADLHRHPSALPGQKQKARTLPLARVSALAGSHRIGEAGGHPSVVQFDYSNFLVECKFFSRKKKRRRVACVGWRQRRVTSCRRLSSGYWVLTYNQTHAFQKTKIPNTTAPRISISASLCSLKWCFRPPSAVSTRWGG